MTKKSRIYMNLELIDKKPKRRDRLIIMTEIIGIAKNGSSKTHIMFKANLSFKQLNKYLSLLLHYGLLERFLHETKQTYKATTKGVEFMERQCQIIDMLNRGTIMFILSKNPKSFNK